MAESTFQMQKELTDESQIKHLVMVVVAYKSNNDEELDLQIGDTIEVLQNTVAGDDSWGVGVCKGKQGKYPRNCVEDVKSADTSASEAGKGDNLDDLFSTLKQQITSTGWLQDNTADKWVSENPQLAKDYLEAAKKS